MPTEAGQTASPLPPLYHRGLGQVEGELHSPARQLLLGVVDLGLGEGCVRLPVTVLGVGDVAGGGRRHQSGAPSHGELQDLESFLPVDRLHELGHGSQHVGVDAAAGGFGTGGPQ